MAENVTLAPLANLSNDNTATATINANSTLIEEAFLDVLSLSGEQPNAMQANLDMNGRQIINLPAPSTINSPARLIDVVGNPTLTIINPILPVLNLRDYGALGNGVADDSTAILAWLTAIQNTSGPVAGYAPMGNYIFKSALYVGAGGKGDVTIYGDGPYQTIFTYSGVSTSIDLFTIGDGISQNHGWNIHDFRITSTSTMVAGTAFHTKLLGRSFIHNVVMDGQDGTGKLWNGFWFDAIDTTTLDGFEARGQNDGLRCNGKLGGPQGDLFIRSGKIASCAVGLRIGGAIGGVNVDDTDIIVNDINVSIDQTLVATANNQIFFGKGLAIDTPLTGPCIQVLDVGASESYLFLTGTWIASSPNNGFNVGPGSTFNIEYTGGAILNNQHDGFYDGSGGTAKISLNGVAITRNGGSGSGYGINASVPVFIQINACHFDNNFSGHIASNVNGNVSGGSLVNFLLPFGNGLGIYYGDDAPTITAAKGSLYVRTNGSSTTTRLYINTSGSTTWTNVVTSA